MGLESDAAVPVASPVHPANSTRVPGLTPAMLAFNPATANDPDTYHPVPIAVPCPCVSIVSSCSMRHDAPTVRGPFIGIDDDAIGSVPVASPVQETKVARVPAVRGTTPGARRATAVEPAASQPRPATPPEAPTNPISYRILPTPR